MKRFISYLLLISIFSMVGIANELIIPSVDSVYMIVKDGFALTDRGIGMMTDGQLVDELPTETNVPTLQTIDQKDAAQCWTFEVYGNGAFTLRNVKTKRYLWSNYILPQSSFTWRQAYENDQWQRIGMLELSRLYMGPCADSISLGGYNTFKCHTLDEQHASAMTNQVMANQVAATAIVSIGTELDDLFLWDFVSIKSSTILPNVIPDHSFRVIRNSVTAEVPFSIYTLLGKRICDNRTEVQLAIGVYVLLQGGTSHKIIIQE